MDPGSNPTRGRKIIPSNISFCSLLSLPKEYGINRSELAIQIAERRVTSGCLMNVDDTNPLRQNDDEYHHQIVIIGKVVNDAAPWLLCHHMLFLFMSLID